MIVSSWLLMIASLAFSYATPIDKMHPERPLQSLFHPTIFFSMFGQARRRHASRGTFVAAMPVAPAMRSKPSQPS